MAYKRYTGYEGVKARALSHLAGCGAGDLEPRLEGHVALHVHHQVGRDHEARQRRSPPGRGGLLQAAAAVLDRLVHQHGVDLAGGHSGGTGRLKGEDLSARAGECGRGKGGKQRWQG